jgi:hypothetical protein
VNYRAAVVIAALILVGLMDRQLSPARTCGMSSVLQRVGSMPLLGGLHERRSDRSVIWNHPAHARIWTDQVWCVLIEDVHGRHPP